MRDKITLAMLVLFMVTPMIATAANSNIVTEISAPHTPQKGLSGRHIAMWNSHGYYYNQEKGKWIWQRARLLGTVEDMHTTDYVVNYLAPMLENAGANVYIARERDFNTAEYIIDNDSPQDSSYHEHGTWKNGRQRGFAHLHDTYEECVNPFFEGSYRWCKSTKGEATAWATWDINVEKSGHYGVYIAYRIVSNGATDARYSVHHAGGVSEFSVNQTMGGGTWIYLGSFDFEAGGDHRIVLSNHSSRSGQFITADAIKVGGGMGNVARKPCHEPRPATKQALNNQKEKEKEAKKKKRKTEKKVIKPKIENAVVSGMPRYAEAARYWLQWAGVPDTIYSDTGGDNDYADDIRCRPYWVNYLCGGSEVLPDSIGLNIPIDMALSIHSNAGNVPIDSIVGSWGIVYPGQKKREDLEYANGMSRQESVELYSYVKRYLRQDIVNTFEPRWTILEKRAGYAEARFLDVPALLFETMSHQNFTDMRYGLDPRFKFILSRAIYKGSLRYLADRYDVPFVVQPLPVDNMAMQWNGDNQVKLSWEPVEDELESTAKPTGYVVYCRKGDYGWDNGTYVTDNHHTLHIASDTIHSFYVTAVNDGGESFPSETLSAYRSSLNDETVMIINAFDRVSAPAAVADTIFGTIGFMYHVDGGVPYRYTAAHTGNQYNYDVTSEWVDDQVNPGFGASKDVHDAQLIVGNTFDYPYTHGKSIAQLGYSFLSTSDEAVMNKTVELAQYPYVDVILGKECATIFGNDSTNYDFEAMPAPFTESLTDYCNQGGHLLISGAYLGYDAYDGELASESAQRFITDVLHCEYYTLRLANNKASVACVNSEYPHEMTWNNLPNGDRYAVEQTDIFLPLDKQAVTFMQYREGNSAAVAYMNDTYRCCTLGFPIEVISDENHRNEIFKSIFEFLQHK